MASIIETTAVSLRKGNTEANQAFTGLLGEVTMDEGIDGTGTDPITTIRLHNGVIAGGIPMCRADLLNISTSQLAVGRDMLGMAGEKNLAYADLSNLISSEDAAVRTNLVNIMKDYGLATTDETDTKLALKANVSMSNVDTASLATSAGHAGKNLAYYDMTNVNSTALTDGSNKLGPVLAKADTSNINTANLVNDSIHNNKPAGNKALMYKDMTNVLSNDLYTALFETHGTALHIEQTTNKLSSYFNPTTGKPLNPSDISANAYPTASAVAAYTNWAIENGSFMQTDLNNATSYEPLYANYGVKLSIPKDDQGQPEYTIESNHINPYKYEVGAGGIITAGSGYVAGRLYTNFVDVSMTTIYNTGNYNQKDRLKIMVTAVDANGIPTSAIFWQGYGVNDLGSTFTLHLEDDNNKSVVLNCKCTVYDSGLHPGVYAYTVNSISKGSLVSAGFKANTVYAPQEEVLVNQLFWVAVDAVNGSGGITKCHFLPELSAHYLDASIAAFNPVRPQGTSSLAEVSFTCTTIMPEIGGAGLAKTDLSNLLGMSQAESEKAEGTPWRAIAYEEIPAVTETSIDTKEYYNITSNGVVWDAIKAAYDVEEQDFGIPAWKSGKSYVTSPKPSLVYYNGNIYYCKTANSDTSWTASKWTLLGNGTYEVTSNKKTSITASNTYYPTNTAVMNYVKTQLDNFAVQDTYRGQVMYYLANNSSMPTKKPSGEALVNGDKVMIKSYNSSTVPYIATYNGSSWTYAKFIDETNPQANGDYVYCENLGNWDTTNYHNFPGNLTWNHTTQKLDVAPDAYNQPDEITIVKNDTTGEISINSTLKSNWDAAYNATKSGSTTNLQGRISTLETKINGAYVPAPEFFSPNGNTNAFTLTKNTTGKVAFDVYVDGVFQYPTIAYTYNQISKVITFSNSFKPRAGTNTIAVIYRGIIWGGTTATSTDGKF